ncbi:protein asteroid-like [Ctenocephalides felis]|uniref:protein asteroid-like n=1 Tax=Ctenocephalides felis TaxID=7515 RepID=UPI000E6E2FBC|nr:protein asteroid-like [Ctenocephalides felis]
MGVRGLTTFIAKNADQYFEEFELHDCNLVIDGNNLAAQLYKYVSRCNSGFGGDYDVYHKCVVKFFEMLNACNIRSFVLFDGAYETRKKKTVYSRLIAKQQAASILCPANQKLLQIFPLMMRDVFKNVLRDMGISFIQCDFEADDEISIVAREISCPVLSNDSDFYIYDVEYIPFTSFDQKLTISEKGYTYIFCKIYKIDNFLNYFGGLKKEMLPLLATLLGNDYINKSTFKNFYAHLKLAKTKQKISDQQRTINALLQWLRNETYDSAVEKILSRLKLSERSKILNQILENVNVYADHKTNASLLLGIKQFMVSQKNIELSLSKINDTEFLNCLEKLYMNNGRNSYNGDMILHNIMDVPIWFRFLYNKGLFPSFIMDFIISKTVYSNPQIEDLNFKDCNSIMFPILAYIFKIICPGSEEFTYVGRNDHNHIANQKINVGDLFTNVKFYKFDVLNNFYPATDLFITFFEETIQEQPFDILNSIPKNLHLYILSIFWFGRNIDGPTLLPVHIHSIILCLIYLQFINPVIDSCRSNIKLEKILNKLENDTVEARNFNTDEFNSLDSISKKECYKCALKMVDYFKVDEKLKSSNKLFSRKTVHVFSMFQNVVLQLNVLNSVLGHPMPQCKIHELYNGTFIYNAFNHLKSRTNILAYVELLLVDSPLLFNNYKILLNIIGGFLECILNDNKPKKSKKKGKKTKIHIEQNEEQVQNSCTESDIMDNINFDTTNNVYWLLNNITV